MKIQEIRELVTKARTEKALQATAALDAVKADDGLKMEVSLLQNRYQKNERDNLMGIAEDYGRELRLITVALLTLLQRLENQGDNPPPGNTQLEEGGEELPPPADDITRILFLASNPSDTAKLQLTHEHSLVSASLQKKSSKFPLILERAVTPSEFQRYIFENKPNIVHFSGHGDRQKPDVQSMLTKRIGRPGSATEKVEEVDPTQDESGIFLYDEDKRHSQFVSTSYLKRVFRTMTKRQHIPIEVVLFNACHSGQQAAVISEYVPYVIGTSWSVGDKAASAFAAGFYFGISEGMDVEDAVDYAINETLPYGEPEDRFMLYKDGKKVEW